MKFWRKSRAITLVLMCKNSNLDIVNINAYTKFVEILSFRSQDIERKRNFKRNSDINQGS